MTEVDQTNGYDDLAFTYDARGNMATKAKSGIVSHIYTFDVENRLASVKTGNKTMSFAYDADGQRVLTTREDGTKVYTPFPDYEVEVPTSGATTTRTTYRIAGQMVAVQTKLSTGASTFYYTYTDHLGNVVGLSSTAGAFIANSVARFDPFGNYRTTPDWSANPTLTDHGFTGHRHNNTGAYPTLNVGLIYMNARYYLPEIGRFISADTIVPDPQNPQSYNPYSYSLNSPPNYTDPSGHIPCDSPNLPAMDQNACINDHSEYGPFTYSNQWSTASAIIGAGYGDVAIPAELAYLDNSDWWDGFFGAAAGVLFEPADWAIAFDDGLQWYDAIGFLPLVPATVGRYADDTMTLYRAVSPNELDDIMQTGIFRPDPGGKSMDAKWFSDTLAGAQRWGEAFGEKFSIISVNVPKNVADEMTRIRNLDGISDVWSAIDDVLDRFNRAILDLQVTK